MNRLDIDFVTRTPQYALARSHPVAWLAVACALVIVACFATVAADLRRQQDIYGETLIHAQAALKKQAAGKRAPPAQPSIHRVAAVNNAIEQLNLPWHDVFDALETATPVGIALVAIEPDAEKRIVKGTAEARTSEAMIAYIEDLKRHPFFTSVFLHRHEINMKDPNRPFRFQFELQWESAL